ncbi:MAG: BatD family protein [Chlamydiales bacterium]|nr:BatD family protein [Chlamydiales bacterium]
MTQAYSILLAILLFTVNIIQAADAPTFFAKVSVQITTGYTNEPIIGNIVITRQSWQEVHEKSFSVEGKALTVTKVGDSYPAGQATLDKNTIVLSKYTFSIPGKPRGLYLFPALKVRVGDTVITAPSVSFEVTGSETSEQLQLDARIGEKGPFYPGQKITFQYFISFQSPIQLTREKLPLLEFPGFRTVGAPKIDNMSQGSGTVQSISQPAVALEPGTFNSGPSFIEGYIYGQDVYGNKVVSQTLLQAQAPAVEVTILPFPKEGMPISFNGAIGVFYWKVRAVGPTNIAVGEKITLEVTVSGSGDYDTVTFPNLALQPGFKDVFRLSDLAPVGQMKDGQKIFTVNMRPVVPGITLIPSIQFSSFDPSSGAYAVKQSDPIVISVRPGKKFDRDEPDMNGMPPAVWPLEVQGNIMMSQSDAHARHLQDVLLVYAAIFLVAAFAAQYLFKRLWLDSVAKGVQSRDIILEAIKNKSDPDACCKLLKKALLLRLYEKKITPELVEHPEDLHTDGLQGEIRKLLLSIEQKRFTGLETQIEMKEIINEASQLYYRMNS